MGRKSDIGRFALVPLWVAQKASSSALKAFVVLGTYVNDEQECWPAVQTLADEGDMNEKTMRAALRELRSLGAIEVDTRVRGDGGQSSNLYRLVYAEPVGPPSQKTVPGGEANLGAPPSQKTVGAIEQDPLEPNEQGLLLDLSWREHCHPLVSHIYDAIGEIPRFAPYLASNPHQVRHITELVDEYLDLAPNMAAITSRVSNFKTYWQNDRSKKKRIDGVATLRNYLSRSVASWAVSINTRGGKTARNDTQSIGGIVQPSNDEAILSEVRRRRAERNGG